jgi:BolA protein
VSPKGESASSAERRAVPGGHAGADGVAATLRGRLAPLAPTLLEIRDDSAAHAGHAGAAGGGGHFSLLIVSQMFSGLSRLQRHQRVLREVADLVPHPIHALSIKALAPEESTSQP